MATLNIPNTFVDATTAEASEVNANFTAVKQFAEGLSDGSNIDAGAITSTKLATSAVVEGKIAANAVTTAKIADASITQSKLDPNLQLGSSILEVQVFS